ncbi:hypothetical protein ACXLRS_001187 [Citrobacter youngae]
MNYFFNFMELTNAVPRFYGSLFGPESYSYVGLSFFNFGEKENSGLSASDIIASLALLVSAIALLYSWFQNNQNTKRAIKETFWMREVIIPKFLTPFFEFIQESPERYKSIVAGTPSNQGLGVFYSTYALIEMNRIRDSSHLLSISSKNLGTAIKNHVEDFENEIMAISSYDDYVDTLGNFASKVIFDIQNAQMSA